MLYVGLKSRAQGNCLLLLILLSPSIFSSLPICFIPALVAFVWPVLSLSVPMATKIGFSTVGNTNASSSSNTTPAMLKSADVASPISPTFSSKPSITNSHPYSTMPTSSTLSLFNQTSPRNNLKSSRSAATKSTSLLLDQRVSLSAYPVHFQPTSHLPRKPINQVSPKMSRFLPHPCKCQTCSLETMLPPLHQNRPRHLSKTNLYPGSSKKRCHHTAKLFRPYDSTLLPKHLPTTSASPDMAPSFSTTFLTSSPVTSPSRLANASPAPRPKTSTSLTITADSRKTRRPPLPNTKAPLFEHQPFIVSWNIPQLVCNRYNVSLDTSPFKGVATPAKVPGQFLSLFYTDRLGLYPHVDLTGTKHYNGGIPQRANLKASVRKAREDINYYIPSKTSRGLAVIDWEEWRPLWDRNWGTKRIYQELSVAHVMRANRSLTVEEATEKAKQQFQVAARGLMSGMLEKGKAMRPNYLWGFYLFPSCYNYGWENPNYTGRCSKEVRRQNDELLWLWESSTAFYPSVYLQASLADSPRAALMVRNRVHEALRVSALPRRSVTAPVFVYTRPVFVDQNKRFLSQGDLVNTIGESAAVGASGAVLWGATSDYDDQASCEALSSYLLSALNPYITNVTVASQLCGNFLCRGNGRCVRKYHNSKHHLHLNPESFRIARVQSRHLVLGRPTLTDLKTWSRGFTCQCYRGPSCSPRTYKELAKALKFSVKKGMYRTSRTLNKALLDDMQQISTTKNRVKKNFGQTSSFS